MASSPPAVLETFDSCFTLPAAPPDNADSTDHVGPILRTLGAAAVAVAAALLAGILRVAEDLGSALVLLAASAALTSAVLDRRADRPATVPQDSVERRPLINSGRRKDPVQELVDRARRAAATLRRIPGAPDPAADLRGIVLAAQRLSILTDDLAAIGERNVVDRHFAQQALRAGTEGLAGRVAALEAAAAGAAATLN
jgi:hypothetical protein